MANTYTQIHIHAVFAVQNRKCAIQQTWRGALYKYISGIVQMHEHKMLSINGMPDHVHILFGYRSSQALSDLMQDVKGSSSKWINENRLVEGRFSWQEGYGAFSYKKSDLPMLINYIQNQEEHHKTKSFRKEYINLLNEFEIAYDDRFVFQSLDHE